MTAQHILLILNPVSGKMKSRSGLFDILDELYHLPDGTPASDRRVTVCTTLYRGHATELASAAVAEGYDRVLCCGGDGTLNEVLNGLMHIPPEKRPTLGYIPAGSTNDFAARLVNYVNYFLYGTTSCYDVFNDKYPCAWLDFKATT
mgnify:CR=1 FL=1